MTTNLVVRGLAQAGWSPEILQNLASHEWGGIEITAPDAAEKSEVLALALTKLRWTIQETFKFPEYWVLSGNSAVQSDSAISRRRRFWGSLGSSFPAGIASEALEWQVPAPGGLKFFTAVKKDQVNDELLFRLWHTEKTTWLVACEGCDAKMFRASLADGWSPERSAIPNELLELASHSTMILVRSLIADDGKGVGVSAFGQLIWFAHSTNLNATESLNKTVERGSKR